MLNLIGMTSCAIDNASNYPLLADEVHRAPGSLEHASIHETTAETQSLNEQADPNSAKTTLKIAGPWDALQLELIAHYYALLESHISTLDADQMRGDLVDLAWLEAYDADLSLQPLTLPLNSTLTAEQAAFWTETNSWPDLLIVKGMIDPAWGVKLADLKPILANQSNYRADQVLTGLFRLTQTQSSTYQYLPWRFSIPVLLENKGLLTAHQLPLLESTDQWDVFKNDLIQSAENDDNPDAIQWLSGASQLMQFLPAAYSSQLGWSGWTNEGYLLQDPAMLLAAGQLQDLKDAGVIRTPDSTSFYYQISMSSNYLNTKMQMAGDFTAHKIPLVASSAYQTNPVEVYSIIVPAQNKHVRLASELAAFLAADINSNLLQQRISSLQGYYPVINDSLLWDKLAHDEPEADYFADLRGYTDFAYTTGAYQQPDWLEKHQMLITDYWQMIIDNSTPEKTLKQLRQQIEVSDG